MSRTVTVHLERPITTVRLLSSSGVGTDGSGVLSEGTQSADAGQINKQGLDGQKGEYLQLCQILKTVVDKLNQFHDKVFAEHKEEIAKLSVEIARKILAQKTEDGDYQIEAVVKEALGNAPTHQDIVVHLNPQDLAQCQKLQQSDKAGDLAGVKFVADANIERAECLLESPKGIITSAIDEQLERIAEALKKVK